MRNNPRQKYKDKYKVKMKIEEMGKCSVLVFLMNSPALTGGKWDFLILEIEEQKVPFSACHWCKGRNPRQDKTARQASMKREVEVFSGFPW